MAGQAAGSDGTRGHAAASNGAPVFECQRLTLVANPPVRPASCSPATRLWKTRTSPSRGASGRSPTSNIS